MNSISDFCFLVRDERLDSFKSLRARLNAFFMHFVSEIVFKPDSSPDDQIMEWLLERITSDNTTRKLSLFNSQEVVDPSPVLRSFLLKLLLKCEQSDSVENQLNNLLASWKDEHQLQVQTMVLFMDCHKVGIQHSGSLPRCQSGGSFGNSLRHLI